MDQEILKEIQDLKQILSRVIGTSDQSPENRFSEEALDMAQKDFHKWSIERGEWVKDRDIITYIRSAPWNSGSFIRKSFEFTNWIKRGHEYLYSKKDLIALNAELVARNIDLKRYQEYLQDKAAFDRKITREKELPKVKGKSKPFNIPKGLKNIRTSEIPKPDPEKVRQDLMLLKSEFKRAKLAAYIDVYKGTHAMLRHLYPYTKYLEPTLLRQCRKWVDDFNLANDALHKITGKKEKFVVDNPEQIQL